MSSPLAIPGQGNSAALLQQKPLGDVIGARADKRKVWTLLATQQDRAASQGRGSSCTKQPRNPNREPWHAWLREQRVGQVGPSRMAFGERPTRFSIAGQILDLALQLTVVSSPLSSPRAGRGPWFRGRRRLSCRAATDPLAPRRSALHSP